MDAIETLWIVRKGTTTDGTRSDPEEGCDPDDPAVVTGIDMVRWTLSIYVIDQDTGDRPTRFSVASLLRRCNCRGSGRCHVHHNLERHAHLVATGDHTGNTESQEGAPKPTNA
ncbi:hypothetical protein [Mycobacterium malmoense]|uniref:hypothetical protein n=1 Tax=Mycobacterium malmoense TaxID=1780 RepID=UPI0011461622|nr:hypothetical protein [Mycobacterium malmoense]